jgi:DNA polymerase I-like protein with 3'-5' exonuclease and polymerase domains
VQRPITIDFETMPIGQRPLHYPPKPVGVAIKWPGQPSRYWGWGHPGKNNCTPQEGLQALKEAWYWAADNGTTLLFHNSKFDVAVACEALGLPMLPWAQYHDTLFLAYLADPHAASLGLKELAEDLLEWPPDERDAVADWIMARGAQLHAEYGLHYGLKRPSKTKTGAYIAFAPCDLVAPYACGDVDRTAALFDFLYPAIVENGMEYAYDTERELMPILLANEREGMRADVDGLWNDIAEFRKDFDKAEDWIRRELRASGLNIDSDDDVGALLLQRGIVPADQWTSTKSGKLSVSKDNLRPEHFTGPNGAQIASVLGYRNRLKTCLTMFMEPWFDQAEINGGYITTNWNQTRGAKDGGTRSGRPSTNNHNFLNISKDFETKRDDGYEHPAFLQVRNLPLCRRYILPDKGEVFCHRDFDGQEMRVFANGEQGDLWQQYQDNPALDPHEFVGEEFMRVAQREFERTKVKTLNFQGIYGGGIPALQKKLRCSASEAKELKVFHDKALPGRKILNEEIQKLVRRGLPIRTWGGRLYFVESPHMVEGRLRNFEYKLINYYCQGSAADLTKRAIIDWHNHPKRVARFLVTVYDEINMSAAERDKVRQMQILREAMEAPRLTVPMLSSGKWGQTWGDLVKCE